MTPEEAVQTSAPARAFAANDRTVTHGEGKVIAYCDGPQYLIETGDGLGRFWWRADLTELRPPRPEIERTYADETKRVTILTDGTLLVQLRMAGPDGFQWADAEAFIR